MATKINPNITIPLVEYTAANAQALKSRPKFTIHTVQNGESLQAIATRHGLPYQQVLETNLSYNLATLTEKNPDLVERINFFIDHQGIGVQQVPLTLNPGQTILIPFTWRNHGRRHAPESIYGLNTSQIDNFSSGQRDPETLGRLLAGLREENNRNDDIKREERGDQKVPAGLAELKMRYDSVLENLRTTCQVEKDDDRHACLSLNTSINMAEAKLDQYVNSGASFDKDGDGWFDAVEYAAATVGAELLIPKP